ncbi:hypothetical protein [Methylophilus sp. 5]|uniref:hypothetical protein n=1 Tax=Methylophilus sp. 5 TaxID=1112274 RepID=UPI0004916741|nr:hypothetical protein [Methylophilus sp. 5]
MFDIFIESQSKIEALTEFYQGKLILHQETEYLACYAKYWKSIEYKRQWSRAAKHILHRSNKTAGFVTAANIKRNPKNISWWIAFKNGNQITFREQLLSYNSRKRWLKCPNAEHAHKSVPKRLFLTTNYVSEWKVSVGAMRKFLSRRNFA